MKILLVHKFFYVTGGAEIFFFETARILKENGHEIAFFSTKNKLNKKTKYERYFVKPPKFDLTNIGQIIYSKKAKQRFAYLLDDFKPNIVHVFGIFSHISPSILETAKERQIPVVMSCNDYKHICPNYKLFHHGELCEKCRGKKFYQAILNKCCHNSITYSVASATESWIQEKTNMVRKNVDLFLFASDFMAKKTELFWGKNSFKWQKLVNPIKINHLKNTAEIGDYILFFGRLIEEKGVKELLLTMKNLPKIKLIVVGGGPEKNILEKTKKELSIKNVEFVGEKWGEEMKEIIRKSRIVVVPSRWYENFPYVIIQAFMMGKPVVATKLGGIPELVKKQFGILYDPQKEGALARAINYLWQRPQNCLKRGKAARKYIEKEFVDEIFYKNLMNIYNGCLSSNKKLRYN